MSNIIEKLNSINISDLKNIDIRKFQHSLQQSPVILINLILVVGTIFLVITLFSKSSIKEKKLIKQLTDYESLLGAVKKQKNLKNIHNEFINDFSKPASENQLIDKFSELAVKNNVQILTFAPSKASSNNHLFLTTFNLGIESMNYKNLILFIKDIEELPFAIRLERFTAISNELLRNNSSSDKANFINANIHVSTFRIK